MSVVVSSRLPCICWAADVLQWLVGDVITTIAALTGNVGGSTIQNEDAACVSFRMGHTGLIGTLNAGYYGNTQIAPWQDKPR
jgi:hypothetical protein